MRNMVQNPDALSDFVIGYHGTDKSVVDDLLKGDVTHLEPSPRGYDWLGDGIYFWEEDASRAMWWAERSLEEAKKANDQWRTPVKVEVPAVVGAIIYLGNCLDLMFAGTQYLLNDTYHEVAYRYDKQGLRLPVNDYFSRPLDCLVINEACRALQRKRGRKTDTVRAVFAAPEKLDNPRLYEAPYEGSILASTTYKIVCVRSRRSIVRYFQVSQDDLQRD
jgi:hypothetical protein